VWEISHNHPRVVFLDVAMPGFNGYTLCEAVKDEPEAMKPPIYFITAMPEKDVSWHVKRCGAAGFIAKPFTFAEIDAVLAANGLSLIA
jgi:DNA-binding response OmpR family regulator